MLEAGRDVRGHVDLHAGHRTRLQCRNEALDNVSFFRVAGSRAGVDFARGRGSQIAVWRRHGTVKNDVGRGVGPSVGDVESKCRLYSSRNRRAGLWAAGSGLHQQTTDSSDSAHECILRADQRGLEWRRNGQRGQREVLRFR